MLKGPVLCQSPRSGVMGPRLRGDDGRRATSPLVRVALASRPRATKSVHQHYNLSPLRKARVCCARPVHEGRFARRSEVEQSESWPARQSRDGRCGACALWFAPTRPGGRGRRPGLLRGSATRWLDAGVTKAAKSAGSASVWLASHPGSTVPAPKIAASGAPQGDARSALAIARRMRVATLTTDALCGAPLPSLPREEQIKAPTRAAARERSAVAV